MRVVPATSHTLPRNGISLPIRMSGAVYTPPEVDVKRERDTLGVSAECP